MTCYELVKKWKKKYPGTIAWRLFQNSKIIDMHVNPDEEVTFAFAGQKGEGLFDIFQTAVVAVTNKRLLIGQKRVLIGYALNSVTPDLYNDMQVFESLFWGKVVIDTAREKVVLSHLSKESLQELETVISSIMMEEKKKYYYEESQN